jgi:RNA polymerase sigma-70 factor (ECF subfamily)
VSTSREDDIRALLRAHRYVEAFETIVTVFGDRVLRLAVSMTRDRTLAEEIGQDVLVRIWRALPSFRSESSVSTWVYTITRNRCLTALKQRAMTQEESFDEPAIRKAADHAVSARRPRELDIFGLLTELPPHYRDVLILFYIEGRSYEEIANLMEIPLGTVKTNIYRAKRLLAARCR